METNLALIEDLKAENNQAFGKLYQLYFGMVHRFVTKNSGSTTDAQDIFQDTLLVLVEKLRRDDFVLSASPKTYIMAIAKHLWLKKLRTPYKEVEWNDAQMLLFYENIDESIEKEKSYVEKLQNYMNKITSHCNRLLHDIFFKNKSLEEITAAYGYSNLHNTQNQKHKCVEQIRKVKATDDESYSH